MFLLLALACADEVPADTAEPVTVPQMVYLTADYICPDDAGFITIPEGAVPMHIEHVQEFMAGDTPYWRSVPVDRFTGYVSGADCGEDVVRGRFVFAYLAEE